ncbi:uncharacterized protein N7459_005457 [Penicillium hispanicum]|uniref:uncharacterized protein n=1 Tax=Penicillium hispanicum TaxID=1080232 RepID=UPI00253FD943|nr:uncharacterized protein N7459_005457 [Penicillium hispanicum]KAJ5579472.1 hypothetical protein N7459_005457 [Penicillium hispanicum]
MTKGCYTCRRRRIICDNGQPTCRKCRDAGKECLGYQKPLVWVKGGVASRGKMMGRSFDEAKNQMGESMVQHPPFIPVTAAANATVGVGSIGLSGPDSLSSSAGSCPEADAWAQGIFKTAEFADFAEETLFASTQPEEPENRVVHLPQRSHTRYTPTPRGLVDPLFKDSNPTSRFYLSQYQHMTEDFVVYPQSKNPWREIIPLVGSSPLLAHILSAMGALHYSLLSSSEYSRMPWSPQNLATLCSFVPPEEIESMVMPANSRRPSSKAYHHFLEFKQRTLYQLSKDLDNPTLQKDDRTLAAIFVLAFLDLLESGSGAWSYHIEGAKKLLRSRPETELGQTMLQGLEAFAVDGCLIMEIMGSTLARPGALSKPFYSAAMSPVILKRLEVTSWVGCPAYLLEVIFYVHTLWFPDSEIAAAAPQPAALPGSLQLGRLLSLEAYAALLQGIRNFNPVVWAQEMQHSFFLADLTSRISLARAYQTSVYLYTSRVLSRAREGFAPPWIDIGVPVDHAHMASELVGQICSIPRSDPHFKCLIWPTFIAGAECRRISQRALLLEKLGALYQAVTSVNVCNAAWVLRLMWQKQDLKQRACQQNQTCSLGRVDEQIPSGPVDNRGNALHDFDSSFDWIDELDESRLDWLFI